MLLESQIPSQPLTKRLILTFFHQSFLSRDAYDRALGHDVINGRSKLTSQRQFASVRGRNSASRVCHVLAPRFLGFIASSTVGGSLGSFDRDLARQNITRRAPGYLHSIERPCSLLRFLLGFRCFLSGPFCFIHRTSYPTRAYYIYLVCDRVGDTHFLWI